MTASTAQDDVAGSPSGPDHRACEVDLALDETRRALLRDESHVVVVAPPTAARGLPTLLLNSLDTPLHAVVLPLAGSEQQSAAGCVLSALGLPPDGEPETRAQIELEQLASSGSGLVLLLPDALGIEKTILRGLGRLAAATRRTLRLVLFVAPEQPSGIDPVATLVQALGVGAEKVVLGPPPREQAVLATAALPAARPSLPDAGAPLSARPGPLRPAPKQPYKAHKLKRRQPRARRRSLPSGISACLLLAPCLVLWAVVVDPDLREDPFAAARALPPLLLVRAAAAASPTGLLPRVAAPAATFDAHPTEAIAPQTGESHAPESVQLPVAPAPAVPTTVVAAPVVAPRTAAADPPRSAQVAVSLNAFPWARIEVDGVPAGMTPLAGLHLSAGEHQLRAWFPDGRIVDRRLHVDPIRNHFRIR